MIIEPNSIHHGDCLDLMLGIRDKSIDLIFADLPYGTTRCAWDSVIDLSKLWDQYERIIKDNGAILLNAQTPFDKVLGASNLKLLRYEWIWEKTHPTGHLNAKKMPMKAHENLLVFYKKLPTYNPQKTFGHKRKIAIKRVDKSEVYGAQNFDSIGYDSTERYPRSVLKIPSDKQTSNLHPTQKPLALGDYFVKTYSNPGDIVFDNCCGSGTYGEAAKINKRRYILMDNDIKSYNQTIERLS